MPPELVVPSPADAARIAEVINARSRALHGVSEESPESVARWFTLPSIEPAADMRLAVDSTGVARGYADVGAPGDGTPRAWVDLRTLPECDGGRALLFPWAERRAEERAGVGGSIWFFVDAKDDGLRELLGRSGYARVRSSFEMERSLEGKLEEPAWPEGIEARPFAPAHAERVHAAQEDAFADHWGFTATTFEEWRAHHLGVDRDPSLWRIAWAGEEVAGVCLNSPGRGEDDTVGWIDVLGVRRSWRGRGLGEALLRAAFRAFAKRGLRRAGLGVDSENTTGAVALYERVGMHVVRGGDTWERRL